MKVRRFSIALLLAYGLGFFAVDAASADPGAPAAPSAPNANDVAAAHTAATGSLDTLGKFFAAGGHKPQGSTQQQTAAAIAAAPRIDSATVPVYYLNPAFVRDPAAPVGQLVFMATDAVSSSGAHASVWTARTGGTWKVVNIASGSDETSFAAKAAPGATVFEEPQIAGWYELLGGRVLPLNDTARASVGSGGVSVANYYRLVRSRYADKLPGSAYDRSGYAGGFQAQGPAKPDTSVDDVVLATAGAVGAGLALGGAVALGYRLRRRGRA